MADTESDRFPLHTAAREGRVAAFEGLLKTDPKLSKRKDDDGRYAIHWAASSNNHEIVLLLANQASFDPDIQDDSGWTPLMISASVPNSEPVLNLLLSRGADVNIKSKSYSKSHTIYFISHLTILICVDNNGQVSQRVILILLQEMMMSQIAYMKLHG
ncbi:Ankyrin repeat protein [Trichoderma simmonsii]|uniref:Ankyrin repeat protein n=1 Tax=Trichoderma simmonsii TaxID=1491479 RepID=A0A8G0LBR1_9HYPO|nr:Ankyrin repeat protein [Trichoderma simmonsii]